MTIEQIIYYASIAIGAIVTVISCFTTKKSKKAVNTIKAENTSLLQVNSLAKIVQKIPDYVNQAEKLFPSDGEFKFGAQKLAWVLQKIEIDCIYANIDFHEREFVFEIKRILSTPQEKGVANEKTSDA